jgi:toxin-antitoxin system PIN domain toxin
MKGYLLDVNVLIALAWPNHAQHAKAHEWFAKEAGSGWSTCMVTQLAFVRISSHPSVEHHVSTQDALAKLREIAAAPGHEFWSEPPQGYLSSVFSKTVPSTLTHASVTDGYLATVAAFHGGKLATLDKQLTKLFDVHAVLI